MRLPRGVAWLALAVVVSLAAPRGADAQYFGQNKVQYRQYDWRSITSDHFEVFFYSGLDSLARRTGGESGSSAGDRAGGRAQR